MADPGGFVAIHRALMKHPAFVDEGEAMLFGWLVLRAAWQPTEVRYRGWPVDLKRGQLVTTVRDMAKALGRSRSWADRFLKRLKSAGMIDAETLHFRGTGSETGAGTGCETGAEIGAPAWRGTAATRISVRNYAKYQAVSDRTETGAGRRGGTAAETGGWTKPGQSRDDEQQGKQVKQDSPLYPPKGDRNSRKRIGDRRNGQPVAQKQPRTFDIAVDWQPDPLQEDRLRAFVDGWSPDDHLHHLKQFRATVACNGFHDCPQEAWSRYVFGELHGCTR